MINLIWLRTFCTLVDVGHFTQTADKLFMTQSGVSQHIKKLEQYVGTALLIREGKSFIVTESGNKLYKKGLQLLKAAGEIETSISTDEPLKGEVKIASPGSIGLKLYPELLTVQQENPLLTINYSFAPNHSIEQSLNERKLDVGLLTQVSQSSHLSCQAIGQEPLVLVTSDQHKTISWPLLAKLGLIAHPDVSYQAQQLLSKNFSNFDHVDQFKQTGFSNQISLILTPVARNLGFTVLPLYAVQAFVHQEKIIAHTLSNTAQETLYICQNRHTPENKRTAFIKENIRLLINENIRT